MKKIISFILLLCLLLSTLTFTGCNEEYIIINPKYREDIDPTTVDYITDTWVMAELSFTSDKSYEVTDAFNVIMDAVFTHKETGETLTIPSFYNGDNTWCVRFAPTQYGIWEYKTVCTTDSALNDKTGTIGANDYKGDLEIYKHGFVNVEDGNKYFTYADGTPFFYLGDTHWTMFKEEYDEGGSYAKGTGIDSHFKFIVDWRVKQGYTVYQSEPIDAPFALSLQAGKLTKRTVKDFQEADKYFDYLAKAGLVHANAQFFFSDAIVSVMNDMEYLEKISRYWVARYSAYPVMWTLAQEIDNDFYWENKQDEQKWNYSNNPWVRVAEFIHKYDAYKHPLTGHQEGSSNTTVTGAGLENYDVAGQTLKTISNKGISVFLTEEVTEKTGHNWWGAQWKQNINILPNFTSARDYWNTDKVAVNYEDRYVNLWTNDYGARARGWISYLNGFFGYGYGCIDIWYYKSDYDMDKDTVKQDGVSTITVKDKQKTWVEALDFESGYQVAYMKNFFETIEWWKLVPDFDSNKHFKPVKGFDYNETKNSGGTLYSCATIENDVYVIYLYNTNFYCGTVCGMDTNAEYTLRWFNPRTGQFEGEKQTVKADADGNYYLEKPDESDWVLYMEKVK